MTNPQSGSQPRTGMSGDKHGHRFNFPVGWTKFILHRSMSSGAEGHAGTGPIGPCKGRREGLRAAVQWHTLRRNGLQGGRSEQMSSLCYSEQG